MNGDITKEGITKDLEAMARAGIKQAMIGNIEGGGPVKMFSPEWYALTRHALKEASRVGVGIMMFNAPDWSQSGGPWVKPERSMLPDRPDPCLGSSLQKISKEFPSRVS